MYVGVANAACMHLHKHLIRPRLGLGNILDLPRTAHSGYDRSFHNTSSQHVRCERLCDRCKVLDARIAYRTRVERAEVS